MAKNSTTQLDPEFRFPKRLARAQRIGCEIAREIGRMRPVGGGLPMVATLGEFHILSFTPFNQPRGWRNINWAEERVRRSLHGLRIGADCGTCLSVIWMEDEQHFFWVRDPSGNKWDRELQRCWNDFQDQRDRSERRLCARTGATMRRE